MMLPVFLCAVITSQHYSVEVDRIMTTFTDEPSKTRSRVLENDSQRYKFEVLIYGRR